ncbi:MAG: DUF2252 family protein, partial [Pseudolabrys sp.]
GRGNDFSRKEREAAVLATARSYRKAMTSFAAMRNLQVWYARLPMEQALRDFKAGTDPKRRKKAEANVVKARTRDSMHAYEKLTHLVHGEPRIISDPPLIVPIVNLFPKGQRRDQTESEMRDLYHGYRDTLDSDLRALLDQFRYVHLARKAVGVGSVGTRDWIVLFLGVDSQDPLFLQIKEAQPSVLERFVGKSEYSNHGERVVAGQRLMQAATDIFIGWHRFKSPLDGQERDFYVRRLKDWKGSLVIDALGPGGLAAYGKVCGWTLGRAHARSGDRIAISAYLGKSDHFDRAMVSFAETYADQNERDFAALQAAVASGRVKAERDL